MKIAMEILKGKKAAHPDMLREKMLLGSMERIFKGNLKMFFFRKINFKNF